jgi:hypothetical protein
LILMRLAGQWLYNLQHWDDLPDQIDEPAWLGIGFVVADWGGLLFLLSLALGGIGIYRLRQGKNATGLLNATMLISLVLIVAYVSRRLGDDRQTELSPRHRADASSGAFLWPSAAQRARSPSVRRPTRSTPLSTRAG